MKQKHYINIQSLIEESTDFIESNKYGFEPGDIIQITEKFDGSNSCIAYDKETDKIVTFSSKYELSFNNTLGGFWEFGNKLSDKQVEFFKNHSELRWFGEWSNRNKIIYFDTNVKKHWYVFDIYDVEAKKWLTQDLVKQYCTELGFEYINVLYDGPFVSWEHCKSFMNSPHYGDIQEGIVVKNQTKLKETRSRYPIYLKVVNDSFKESIRTNIKELDPEVEKAKQEAMILVESIVTRNRVEKEIYKMRDENILEDKIKIQDIGKIAKVLPKRIYYDCLKEERETVELCGENFSKMCGKVTMKWVRKIILG